MEWLWIGIILGAAALVGVCAGVCVAVLRWYRRVRVAPDQGVEERPWEVVELILRCCRGRRDPADVAPHHHRSLSSRWHALAVLWRAAVVVTIGALTLGCGGAALGFAAALRERLQDIGVNAVGDPEKTAVDSCMRDFEGLSMASQKYQDQLLRCVQDLSNTPSSRWLPRVRLTVDERICNPEDLCRLGDPSGCADKGTASDPGYRPGHVTQCYNMIQTAKSERVATVRKQLLADADYRCTRNGAWSGYSMEVHLNYCMWKQMATGVCMNSMRTNCPKDTSCCPVAQNAHVEGSSRSPRPNQYVCAKSPTFGLFCQYADDHAPLPPGNDTSPSLCTSTTCDTFDWCADLADIPGLCLGEACQAYGRSLDLAIVIIVFCGVGLIADFADWVMLCKPPSIAKIKLITNYTGACLKLVAYLFSLGGGLSEFVDGVLEHKCFNDDGRQRVQQAQTSIKAFRVLILAAMGGSFVLSPLSARWANRVIGLPRVRSI